MPMDVPYTVDIDAVCSDYVKQAELVNAHTESDASRLLFVKAAAVAAECTEHAHVVMIECQSRDHLVDSIRDEVIVDPSGLDKITIKYTPTFDMLRALLAAWHCDSSATGASTSDAMNSEASFLVWDDKNERKNRRGARTPDYLFIDGMDAVATEAR
ncbi:hypothetical protein GGI20_001335 [Coemansia sp. BCRC 34301]|nr:hypothetical protein GGI20_001335 [Coemansia sp. BCRC 34301]